MKKQVEKEYSNSASPYAQGNTKAFEAFRCTEGNNNKPKPKPSSIYDQIDLIIIIKAKLKTQKKDLYYQA